MDSGSRTAELGPIDGRHMAFIDLMQLLTGCVIGQNYVVRDSLVQPIALTDLGERVRSRLRQKFKKTRPNEATLKVALRLGIGSQMLVDVSHTDLEALQAEISTEIREKRLLFVDQYQPDFAEELFRTHDFRRLIKNPDAVKFLKPKEQGVFQLGHFTVGPWGCQTSNEYRVIAPNRDLPGYLCENSWCTKVHTFHFETSDKAAINKLGEPLDAILEEYDDSSRQLILATQFESARRSMSNPFVDSAQLMNFLGDALTEAERQSVTNIALRMLLKRSSEWRQRISVASGRVLSDPQLFTSELSFGQTMQLLHMLSDETLIQSVNEAVGSGLIHVEQQTARSARLARRPIQLGLAELGPAGIRFRPQKAKSHVIVGHLLQQVYARRSEDLAYALQQQESEPLDSLISHAFQTMDVPTITAQCLVSDRTSMKATCSLLHISTEGLARDEISESISWRLGLSSGGTVSQVESILASIERYLSAPTLRDEEDKRGDLSNIYVPLETELLLAIRYCEWALLSDHYASSDGFVLFPAKLPDASRFVIAADGSPIGARPTLAPLASAFSKLADHLDQLTPQPRPEADIPIPLRASNRPFAFAHISIFHDLTPASQERLRDSLKSASRDFANQTTIDVRNAGHAHGNTQFPSDESIREALGFVQRGLQTLLKEGLLPIISERKSKSSVRQGQSDFIFHSPQGDLHIRVPNWPQTPRLPGTEDRLIILPNAQGAGWGPLRFSVPEQDRGGAKWANWPPRRRSNQTLEWSAAPDDNQSAELEATSA